MNRCFALCLLFAGTVETAVCASFPTVQTLHRFYADGYRAVADEMPEDFSPERIPPHILRRVGAGGRSTVQKDLTEKGRFWRRRSFEMAYALEKHFYEERFDGFTNTLHWIQSDLSVLWHASNSGLFFRLEAALKEAMGRRHTSDAELFFRVYTECILMALLRLQEEKTARRDWLTQRRLDELFSTRTLYQRKVSKEYATFMTMMLIGNKLSEYERKHGRLPQSLEELEAMEELKSDAWKRPILYTQTGGRWFLLSLGERGIAGGIDIDNNSPFFQYGTGVNDGNIVLYSDFIKTQNPYYTCGSLKLGRFSFERNPKTGTLSTSTSRFLP